MLYVAMLYKHIDVMFLSLIGIVLIILLLEISAIHEEKRNSVKRVHPMHIINNTMDASVSISRLVLVPGTDYIYMPLYSYFKNGVEHTTLSYRKCKMMMRSV